jgi:hypothetical protein
VRGAATGGIRARCRVAAVSGPEVLDFGIGRGIQGSIVELGFGRAPLLAAEEVESDPEGDDAQPVVKRAGAGVLGDPRLRSRRGDEELLADGLANLVHPRGPEPHPRHVSRNLREVLALEGCDRLFFSEGAGAGQVQVGRVPHRVQRDVARGEVPRERILLEPDRWPRGSPAGKQVGEADVFRSFPHARADSTRAEVP